MPLVQHPALVYPAPQAIRDYWQQRLECVSAQAPTNGAVKYALDFFGMVCQCEIKAGSSYRYAWTLSSQSPGYCCLALAQSMRSLVAAMGLLVDAIGWWQPSRVVDEMQQTWRLFHILALEELQRIQALYLQLQQELFEIAREHHIPLMIEGVELETIAHDPVYEVRHQDQQREEVSA